MPYIEFSYVLSSVDSPINRRFYARIVIHKQYTVYNEVGQVELITE